MLWRKFSRRLPQTYASAYHQERAERSILARVQLPNETDHVDRRQNAFFPMSRPKNSSFLYFFYLNFLFPFFTCLCRSFFLWGAMSFSFTILFFFFPEKEIMPPARSASRAKVALAREEKEGLVFFHCSRTSRDGLIVRKLATRWVNNPPTTSEPS